MNDFSNFNHLPTDIKLLIVNAKLLIEQANNTMNDRNCNFDLTSKRQLKGDCRKLEKVIEKFANGKANEKTVMELNHAYTALNTTFTGLLAFFTR